WSPSGSLSTTSLATVMANPTVTTVYSLAATNSNNCVNTATSQVVISGQPTTINKATLCIGYTNPLTASNPSSNSSFTWSPAATLSSSVGPIVVANPTA